MTIPLRRPAWRNRCLALGVLTIFATSCNGADEPDAAGQSATDVTASAVTSTVADTQPDPTVPPSSTIAVTTVPSSMPATTSPDSVDVDSAGAIVAAETVGQRFMQARADHDGQALVAMMAPDASFGGVELAQSVDEYLLQAEYERIVDWQFLDPSCSASAPNRVVCSYALQDAFNERAGKGPFPGSSFLLEIDGEQIVSASHNVDGTIDFFTETELTFFLWMRENYPNDLDLMLEERFLDVTPVLLTAESIRLWEEHVTEYLVATE